MGPASVSKKKRMHGCPSHVDEGTIEELGGGYKPVVMQELSCSAALYRKLKKARQVYCGILKGQLLANNIRNW